MFSRRFMLLSSAAALIATSAPAQNSFVQGATGHAQVNLDTSTQASAFLNFMKGYAQTSLGSGDNPSKLDNFGYPIAALTTNWGGQITIPASFQAPSTQWVIKVTGTRSLAIVLNTAITNVSHTGAVTVSGSTFTFTGIGRAIFTFNSAAGSISPFMPSGSSYAAGTGDLVLCRVSDEAALTAGGIFTPEYLSFMQATNPRTIRAMPWINGVNGNYTNEVQWNYRTTPGCLSWNSGRFPNGTWAGTISGTDTYSIGTFTDAPASWTGGMVFQGTITNANTSATPTIAVSGISGTKTIVNTSAGALSAGSMAAGAFATFIYDDLLDQVILAGTSITHSIPIETMVALANSIFAHLWFTFPAMVNDSYVSNVATYVRNNLFQPLAFYPEYANEIWNNIFPLTLWATARGAALGFPSGNNEQPQGWYGLRCRQIMGNITALWGSRGYLKRVLAFQAFGNTDQVNKYRLQGFDLNTSLGYTKYNSYVGVSYNTSPNRPVDFADVLAYATYFSGAQCANADASYKNVGGTGLTTGGQSGWTTGLLGAADAYAAGGSTNIANAIAFLDWDIKTGTNNGTAGSQTLLALNSGANIGSGGAIGIYPSWEAIAASYDGAGRPAGTVNLTVECYEGALEVIAPSTAECTTLGISTSYGGPGGEIDNLITGYKNSATGFAIVATQFNQFKSQAHSLTPCWFVIGGPSQWSLLPGDEFSTPYQTYNGFVAYAG